MLGTFVGSKPLLHILGGRQRHSHFQPSECAYDDFGESGYTLDGVSATAKRAFRCLGIYGIHNGKQTAVNVVVVDPRKYAYGKHEHVVVQLQRRVSIADNGACKGSVAAGMF